MSKEQDLNKLATVNSMIAELTIQAIKLQTHINHCTDDNLMTSKKDIFSSVFVNQDFQTKDTGTEKPVQQRTLETFPDPVKINVRGPMERGILPSAIS